MKSFADISLASLARRSLWLLALLPAAAAAFDSEAWLAKRELMGQEALRLRAAYSNCVARTAEPAKGVKVPLESFSNGSVKTLLEAESMKVFPDQVFVLGERVTIRRFNEKGRETLKIQAGRCVVDREMRSGWIEGEATVDSGKSHFRGRDIYFSATESYLAAHGGSDIKSEGGEMGDLL